MNASLNGPRTPAVTNGVLTPAILSLPPVPANITPYRQTAPTVEPRGFLDSFELPGIPSLTSDIDTKVLKFCSLPTLAALAQASKSCDKVVQQYVECPGEPGGAHDKVRSLRMQRRLREQQRKAAEIEKCHDARPVVWDEDELALTDKINTWARSITEKNLRHLSANLYELSQSQWKCALIAATSATDWQTLQVNVPGIDADECIEAACNALCSIQYRSATARVELDVGSGLSERDAHALLAYLVSNPACKSIDIAPTPQTSNALKILAHGLPRTGIEAVKITEDLMTEQLDILDDLFGNSKLETFAAFNLSLNSDVAVRVANLISKNFGLKSITLAQNALTENDAVLLAQAIGGHPGLDTLFFPITK
ncbi:MAG: hypothetical protein ACRYGK_08465 [Janthinobacterium lividum]